MRAQQKQIKDILITNKTRQRFCRDYNLPINIFSEEMFNYYKDL